MAANKMAANAMVRKYAIPIASKSLEKLYLDAKTADVNFVFGSDEEPGEQIPAHKSILAATSDVFDAMFYGALMESGDVKMLGVAADDFKVFLQFFYFNEVGLNMDNIAGVLGLSDKYNVSGGITVCVQYLTDTLTCENVCDALGLALRYGQNGLRQVCEEKISINPLDVVKSNSSIDRVVLNHILQLDWLQCEESHLLDHCLSWAQTAADRKGLDSKNMQVLREELDGLLHLIRFKSMDMGSFSAVIGSHAGFFNGTELEEIIQMIALPNYQSGMFNNTSRVYVHDEVMVMDRASSIGAGKMIQKIESTRFEVNKPAFMIGFGCGKMSRLKGLMDVSVKIYVIENANEQKITRFETEMKLPSHRNNVVPMHLPILMMPNKEYEIIIEQLDFEELFNENKLKAKVEADNGFEICFLQDPPDNLAELNGLVQRLLFVQA